MKRIKQIWMALLAAFCLLGSSAAAGAAEPVQVTFTNAKDNNANLYVTKQVESADDRYEVPADAQFQFVLKLNGKPASQKVYRLFQADGAEVFRYMDGESTESKPNKMAFQTSRSGDFTLKAGQTALFEKMGAGTTYEITEREQEQFLQTSPAQGTSALGTIPSEGARVVFTNLYVPRSEGKLTNLTVTKKIAFPEGYLFPGETSFQYTLKLDGEAYANEIFRIRDDRTSEIVGESTTDAGGVFTLPAGCTALFADVPAGVDYEVTEAESEGWRILGDAVQKGSTQAPVTALSYTNACAAFGVKKTVTGGEAGEDSFTFLLMKEDKKVFAGAEYYLFDAEGRAEDTLYATDENGRFSLQDGQTAIFMGMAPGTVYHVMEEARPDYVQKLPAEVNGYANKVVTDSVEILPFVNSPAEEGELSVTKLIMNTTEEAPHENRTFTFILREKSGDTYLPVSDAVYGVMNGDKESTYQTDEKGTFTLKGNETARFKYLKQGTVYQAEEVALAGMIYQIDAEENRIQEGSLEGSPELIFRNRYTPKKTDLHILKVDRDSKMGLSGAEFALYMDEGLITPAGETVTTGTDGTAVFPDLREGVYYLKEEKSPSGYKLLSNPVKIEIIKDLQTGELSVKIDGKDGEWQESETTNDAVYLSIYNDKTFRLPLTGGSGIFLLLGISLAGMGALFAVIRKKRTK